MLRRSRVLLALLLLALALSACGGPQQGTQGTGSQGAATQAPAGDRVELTLWHQEQPPHRVKRIQELLDAFMAENPTISIKQDPQNWGEVYTKAPAAVQAQNAPDLLFAIPDFTTLMRTTGAVQPVDDLITTLKQDHTFVQSALDPYTYDGHTWAVPLYGMTMNLWYRKDLLDAAGQQPPTTWEELLQVAKAMTGNGKYGIGLPANKQLYTDQTIYNFMVTAGAQDIFDESGKLIFNNPNTERAFQAYQELWQYSPPDSTGWTWGEAEAAFASGLVPMILQFTVITTFDTQTGLGPDALGVVPMPQPSSGGQRGSIFYSNGVMLLSNDQARQEAASKFLQFLLKPENYGKFLNMEPGLFLPITEAGQTAESFWSDPLAQKYKAQIQTMVEQTQHGYLFGFTKGRVFPAIGKISAQNLLAQTVQRMIVDQQSPQEAVQWGQQQMETAAQQ